MKIKVLIENATNNELLNAEHGLSLLVETGGKLYLVDCGQTHKAFENAKIMNTNFDEVEGIVISHNHYDHLGGIEPFANNINKPIYISDKAYGICLIKPVENDKIISRSELLQKYCDRLEKVEDHLKIGDNIYLCKVKNPNPKYMCKDSNLCEKIDDEIFADNFEHEIYIAVYEDNGIKIISPCTHNGIVNVLEDCKIRFGMKPLSFIGGLHLKGKDLDSLNCSEEFLYECCDMIKKYEKLKIYTCHCTGHKGFEVLKHNLGESIQEIHTGDIFEC